MVWRSRHVLSPSLQQHDPFPALVYPLEFDQPYGLWSGSSQCCTPEPCTRLAAAGSGPLCSCPACRADRRAILTGLKERFGPHDLFISSRWLLVDEPLLRQHLIHFGQQAGCHAKIKYERVGLLATQQVRVVENAMCPVIQPLRHRDLGNRAQFLVEFIWCQHVRLGTALRVAHRN